MNNSRSDSSSPQTDTPKACGWKAALRRHRRKLLLLLAVLLAVGVGPYVVSRARSAGRRVRIVELPDVAAAEFTGNVRTLRILTYNIAHGRGATDGNWDEGGDAKRKRIAAIANLIAEQKPDVVVLNEIDFHAVWSGGQNQAEAIARQAGFRYRVEQRNIDFRFAYGSWKFGNAVLSRYPIIATELIDYPPVAVWEAWLAGKKRGVVCTLELSPGQRVQVVAVHLQTRDMIARLRAARVLLNRKRDASLPMILAGDFNASPVGFPYSERAPAEYGRVNTMDMLTALGRLDHRPKENPQLADFTYPTMSPDRVIDWVLIPREWRFTDYRVIDSDLSDHRPVVATVRFAE